MDTVPQLISGDQLLISMFGKTPSKASHLWLWRQRRARRIPYIKLGDFVYYDPEKVREVLNSRTVKAKA